MKKRVADIIMETLVEKGITDCFAVVGGGAMHLDNALGLNNNIRKTFMHHEQSCSMAAEGYARVNSKMAAVCVTSGPGATNAITGVMGAWQDGLPMIVLSGQVRYATSVEITGLPLRYRGVQEFDIVPSVKNMTKYAVKIKDPLAAKAEVCKAIDIAMSGRRGPVWLDVPLDTQSAIVEEEDMYPAEAIESEPATTAEQLAFVMEKLRSAKRPVILAGTGVATSDLLAEFREFAIRIGVPVVGAAGAMDVMYRDYERFCGMSGTVGPRSGNFAVQNADVILSLGCSLGFAVTGFAQELFAPKAYIMSVDVDEYEMQKPGIRVDYFIHSGLRGFFAAAQNECAVDVPKSWLDYCAALRDRFSPFEAAENLDPNERVCSYQFWKKFEDYEPEDTICVLGNNTAISSKTQIGTKKPGQRVAVNIHCGSMGVDLPAAAGAALSGRPVICATGDGSIMMNLQELQTIKYKNLPVKVVVFTNDGYNAIRQTSKNFFNGFFVGCNAETGISFPDFEKVANAFDYTYRCCHTNAELDDCLKWLFEQEGQVILEVEQRLDDPVTPKVMSRMLPDGTMTTPALHDLYPFLSEEEMEHWMSISKE